jgi:hypothetical protein
VTTIAIRVTTADADAAGPWPKPPLDMPKGWHNPVELAIARAADVDVDVNVDVDGNEYGWTASIGRSDTTTLVVDLDDDTCARLNAYWDGEPEMMEPFDFELEVDDWLAAFLGQAS